MRRQSWLQIARLIGYSLAAYLLIWVYLKSIGKAESLKFDLRAQVISILIGIAATLAHLAIRNRLNHPTRGFDVEWPEARERPGR